jgi:hypothetical protein
MDKTGVSVIVLVSLTIISSWFVNVECLDNYNSNNQRSSRMIQTLKPYLEVDGKKLSFQSSDASSPASITVREKKVINVRCVIERVPSPGVKIISWFINDQNVTHMGQFLMEYQAVIDMYTSQSLLTINVTKDFHGKTLSCSTEHPSWPQVQQPVVTNAVFDVLCEYNDLHVRATLVKDICPHLSCIDSPVDHEGERKGSPCD